MGKELTSTNKRVSNFRNYNDLMADWKFFWHHISLNLPIATRNASLVIFSRRKRGVWCLPFRGRNGVAAEGGNGRKRKTLEGVASPKIMFRWKKRERRRAWRWTTPSVEWCVERPSTIVNGSLVKSCVSFLTQLQVVKTSRPYWNMVNPINPIYRLTTAHTKIVLYFVGVAVDNTDILPTLLQCFDSYTAAAAS